MPNDDPFWDGCLDAFETRPDLATTMAQNLSVLRDKLDEGEKGIQKAKEILNGAIREIYPHTDFSQACLQLYDRYVSKKGLVPSADPIMIIENLQRTEGEDKTESRKTKRSAKK